MKACTLGNATKDLLMAARFLLIDHDIIACKEKLDEINEGGVLRFHVNTAKAANIFMAYKQLKELIGNKLHPRLIKYLNRGYTFPEVEFFNIEKDVHSGMITSLDAVIAINICKTNYNRVFVDE